MTTSLSRTYHGICHIVKLTSVVLCVFVVHYIYYFLVVVHYIYYFSLDLHIVNLCVFIEVSLSFTTSVTVFANETIVFSF
jgi:hypothetical protein